MNLREYLLTCMAEEGAEITQASSKILRFGEEDQSPREPSGPTNREKLVLELNDLLGVAALLVDAGIIPSDWQSPELQEKKQVKVHRYMDYSRKRGCLGVS